MIAANTTLPESPSFVSHSAPLPRPFSRRISALPSHLRANTTILPNLRSSVTAGFEVHRIPRRYEETRPAHIQDFNHNRILVIGQDVEARISAEIELARAEAVTSAETRLRQKAEVELAAALEDLRKNLQEKHHQSKLMLKKRLEEETAAEMQQLKNRLVEESLTKALKEREAADKRQHEAVEETKRVCLEEMKRQVEKVRLEECRIAKIKCDKLIADHKETLEKVIRVAEIDKSEALDALTLLKNDEHSKALKEIRVKERDLAERRIVEVAKWAAAAEGQLLDQVAELREEIEAHLRQQEWTRLEKSRLEKELLAFRELLDDVLHRTLHQNENQAAHLLPLTEMVGEILLRQKENQSPKRPLSSQASSVKSMQRQVPSSSKNAPTISPDYM